MTERLPKVGDRAWLTKPVIVGMGDEAFPAGTEVVVVRVAPENPISTFQLETIDGGTCLTTYKRDGFTLEPPA